MSEKEMPRKADDWPVNSPKKGRTWGDVIREALEKLSGILQPEGKVLAPVPVPAVGRSRRQRPR
jgi:hypothetical protein